MHGVILHYKDAQSIGLQLILSNNFCTAIKPFYLSWVKENMKANKQHLYHLYSRTSFFTHSSSIDFEMSLEKTVDQLFDKAVSKPLEYDLPKMTIDEFKSLSKSQKQEKTKAWKKDVVKINQQWIKQMQEHTHSFVENMTLFWHGHFACRTVKNPYTTLWMNNSLRTHALGNFKDLLIAVSESPAMINYLHLQQNKKNHPNEDFARELMELFTLGRDVDYTEQDITEVARAFTGWGIDNDSQFVINLKKQDLGSKTIFGQTGNFDGYDVIDMILENPNCAKHIARKVYQHFVRSSVNEGHVTELAAVFYDSGYDITTMMKHLLKAEWFYEAKGQLIKSPIHLIIGLGKLLGLQFEDTKTLQRLQHYLGQVLFDPPNVAGWPVGTKWIDSSRLALRIRLGSLFANKGAIEIELTPEIDAKLKKQMGGKQIKFYEEVDWDFIWKQNPDVTAFDLIIRNENSSLTSAYEELNMLNLIQLVSTPDFQLA
jgi:uncharacterized protein (DUF1800 family)